MNEDNRKLGNCLRCGAQITSARADYGHCGGCEVRMRRLSASRPCPYAPKSKTFQQHRDDVIRALTLQARYVFRADHEARYGDRPEQIDIAAITRV